MDSLLLLIVAFAAVGGVGLGWVLATRAAAPLREERMRLTAERDALSAERDAVRDRFNAAIRDLAVASERAEAGEKLRIPLEEAVAARAAAEQTAAALRPVAERAESLETQLAVARGEKEALAAAKAAFERGEQERTSAHETQLTQLRDLQTKLEAQFRDLANRALTDAQGKFLERANERFTEAGKESEAKLKLLLQPVETTLKRYEENLALVEKDRVGVYGELKQQIEHVRAGQSQVRDETAKLVNALRSSPKARGRWGEQSLKNVLEQAGLSSYVDFQTEVSVDTGDGRLRPDVIVSLPGGRKLIIDAKCSLNAFLDAADCVDETVRVAHLKAHAGSIRNHAQQLGSKAYWQQFGDAADYVVMYIPGEHFLTAALEQDDGLWDWAFERRVLLATPTNLVAIARTVATVWRQEKLAEEAAEIARLGKELHESLFTLTEHFSRLGKNLGAATASYNETVSRLEGRVLTRARRFETLDVSHSGKAIGEVPVVETTPRALTRLETGTLNRAAE